MNRGLIEKALRELWLLSLVIGCALFIVVGLITFVIDEFHDDIVGVWGQLEFVTKLFRALVGSELGDFANPFVLKSIPWSHPIVLAPFWAFVLSAATRVPVAEIERGTIDVLCGLPVTRWTLYVSETVVFASLGVVLVGFAVCGNLVGTLVSGAELPSAAGIFAAAANAYALLIAVGGVTYLFSSISDRRGTAIGCALAIVLFSFLLTFVAPFYEPVQYVTFLSLLDYYHPLNPLKSGDLPWSDLAVLFVFGGVSWALGGWTFHRRDICTV